MATDPGLSSMGQGAMVLEFDIAPEAQVEHDDWHSQEHLRTGSAKRINAAESSRPRNTWMPMSSRSAQ